MTLQNKKIAMIIAFQDFRDEEYFIPQSIFLAEGGTVKTVSSQKGSAIGSYGGVVDVDLTLDELQVADFEAIIFIGGSGAARYIDDKICHKIAREAVSQGRGGVTPPVLAAICIAPAILARSGVLKGKKATVWSSNLDKSAIKILKEEGTNYVPEPVVVDGKIVTANGPGAARKFGETVIKVLQNF